MNEVFITDTTLREGLQSAIGEMTIGQRKDLFYDILNLNVKEIEVGVPAHSKEERGFIKSLIDEGCQDKIIAWNRANIKDINYSLQCNVKLVEVSFPISDIMIYKKLGKDRKYIFDIAKNIIPFCKEKGLYISCGLEDATRADFSFLEEFVHLVKNLGADRIRYSDTLGIANPMKVYKDINILSKILPVEVHLHNDFGMATANAVSAMMAGASYINTTILGLGERVGITPLEEISLYAEFVLGYKTNINVSNITILVKKLTNMLNINIPPNKPIYGANAFTNKSSIHIKAQQKSKDIYLPFDPNIIGLSEEFCFGYFSKAKNE
ncbi:LeuA family protein [Hydrogenobaculum acidophilum]